MDFIALLKEERKKAHLLMQKNEEKISAVGPTEVDIHTPNTTIMEAAVHKDDQSFPINLTVSSDSFIFDHYRLPSSLPSLFYIPAIIDERTEHSLLQAIDSQVHRWHQLKTRKVQQWGRIPSSSGNTDLYESQQQIAWPKWIDSLAQTFDNLGLFQSSTFYPNNVLINRYEPTQGILHHTDGPSYNPYVVILSLGADCVMTFKPKLTTAEIGIKSDKDICSVVLQSRSILIFAEELYTNYMHGIYEINDEYTQDIVDDIAPCLNLHLCQSLIRGAKVSRGLRTSITLRQVKT